MEYEFAIQRKVINNGQEIFVPLVRRKSRIFKNKWDRIILQYNRYMLSDLDWDVSLTVEQCEDHIRGYKLVLEYNKPRIIHEDKIIPLEVFKL